MKKIARVELLLENFRNTDERVSPELAIKYVQNVLQKQGIQAGQLTVSSMGLDPQSGTPITSVAFFLYDRNPPQQFNFDCWYVYPGDYGYSSGMDVGDSSQRRIYGEW